MMAPSMMVPKVALFRSDELEYSHHQGQVISPGKKTMAISDVTHCGVDFDLVLDAVESPAGAQAGSFSFGTFFVVPEVI